MMARIMSDQRKILISAFPSIKVVRVQDIHREDCQFNWFIVKSTTGYLTRIIEKNKYKAGRGVSVKL